MALQSWAWPHHCFLFAKPFSNTTKHPKEHFRRLKIGLIQDTYLKRPRCAVTRCIKLYNTCDLCCSSFALYLTVKNDMYVTVGYEKECE